MVYKDKIKKKPVKKTDAQVAGKKVPWVLIVFGVVVVLGIGMIGYGAATAAGPAPEPVADTSATEDPAATDEATSEETETSETDEAAQAEADAAAQAQADAEAAAQAEQQPQTPEEIAAAQEADRQKYEQNSGTAAIQAAIAAGLQYTDVVVGTGAMALPGATVYVKYTGKLADGTVFDSTDNHGGQPIEFILGNSQVITGWDTGIVGMQVGGKRQLVIPPALGYPDGSEDGSVPPDSILYFDVELVDVVYQ